MDPELTGQAYDRVAEHWQHLHLLTNGIAQFERAIQFTTLRGPALDIGCGSSGRFLNLLLKNGFAPEGVDVSTRMIELARKKHPSVTFHHADFSQWRVPHRYNFIAAWDSLWHLPLAQQEPVLRKICNALEPGGIYIFTTGGLDGPAEKTDSVMPPDVYHCTLGIPKWLELLAECGCVCRHLEYDQYPEKHLYIIAQKTAADALPSISPGGGGCREAGARLCSPVPDIETPHDESSPVKILVIEDNTNDQELLIRQLHKSGIDDRVLCVDNGTDAMELVRTGARKLSAVAAVFLDLSLPGVNGLLLLQAIRSNVETALLPVFIMSGSTNPHDEAECRRLGATSFIPKKLLSLPSFRATITDIFRASRPAPENKPTS